MNPVMTNDEFYQAWRSLSFNHHAPENYWDEINEQRKKHKLVGKKARVDGKTLECIRADDTLIVFRLSQASELLISGEDVDEIIWL